MEGKITTSILLKLTYFRKKLLLLTILCVCTLAAAAQDNALAVIVNPKGTPHQLKINELKSIMKGERQRWSDGTKIIIALMKTNTPAGSVTCKKVYNMSSDELNKFWLALVFQGKAQAPNFFSSASELESFVAQTPGAIGVVTPPDNEVEARTIPVDGQNSF